MIKGLKIAQSVLLTIFGVISVFLTLSIVFDWFGIRELEGDYVSFIVYANLLCGILYIYAASVGWKKPKRAANTLALALIVLVVGFVWLQVYIDNGGVYEAKTIKAMIFRITFTAIMAALSLFILKKQAK